MFLKRCLDARSGVGWFIDGMVAQSKKIRYQWLGGSLMECVFRQGMGGQSFLSSLGQGVGGVIDGRDVFRGGRFQAMDSVNQSVNLVRSRSQVTSALSARSGGGSSVQNSPFSPGRDDGLDSVQGMISAFNGLELAGSLF